MNKLKNLFNSNSSRCINLNDVYLTGYFVHEIHVSVSYRESFILNFIKYFKPIQPIKLIQIFLDHYLF